MISFMKLYKPIRKSMTEIAKCQNSFFLREQPWCNHHGAPTRTHTHTHFAPQQAWKTRSKNLVLFYVDPLYRKKHIKQLSHKYGLTQVIPGCTDFWILGHGMNFRNRNISDVPCNLKSHRKEASAGTGTTLDFMTHVWERVKSGVRSTVQ